MASASPDLHPAHAPAPAPSVQGEKQQSFYPFLLAAVIGLLGTISVFFPGLMSPDSFDQLNQARSLKLANWHPPLMAWVWHHTDLFIAGPFGMLLLQATAWWGGLALIISKVTKHRLAPLLVLLVGFWPPIFGMSGTIWKDVQLVGAFTVGIALLLEAQQSNRKRMIVPAIIMLLYGAALRHNSMFAAIPLFAWSALLLLNHVNNLSKKTKLVLAAVMTLVMMVIPRTINGALTDEPRYPLQQLLVYDLLAISVDSGENFIPSYLQPRPFSQADLKALYTSNGLAPMYWPSDINHIRITYNPAEVEPLKKLWLKTVLTHKKSYLKHRTALFLDQMGFASFVSYPFQTGMSSSELGVSHSPSKFSGKVFKVLDSLKNTLLFRTWAYLLVLLVCLGVTLRGALRRESMPLLATMIALSGLLYIAPYYLVSVGCDLRFNLWAMICAWLTGIVTVHSVLAKRKNRATLAQ